MFRSSSNSRVPRGFHFANSRKASSSKSNERPGLGSSLINVSPE